MLRDDNRSASFGWLRNDPLCSRKPKCFAHVVQRRTWMTPNSVEVAVPTWRQWRWRYPDVIPSLGRTMRTILQRRLAVRHEGVQRLIRGIGLLGASLLVGTALGLFSDTNDWIMIWLVFVGWMAAWGVISLVSGIGSMAEARFLKKRLEQVSMRSLPPAYTERETGELPTSKFVPLPTSVTEHTTKSLSQHRPAREE